MRRPFRLPVTTPANHSVPGILGIIPGGSDQPTPLDPRREKENRYWRSSTVGLASHSEEMLNPNPLRTFRPRYLHSTSIGGLDYAGFGECGSGLGPFLLPE